MTYLNLIPALMVIAAYFLGRHIGKRSRDDEVTDLKRRKTALETMLDFVQGENEHLARMLKEKVTMANAPTPPARTDPITEWPLSRACSFIPESMNKEVLYGVGHTELQREAQEKYTAAMRKKLDNLFGY